MIALAFAIGIIAGLRTMMAPAAIAWAAATGGLHLEGSGLAFLGWRFTPWIFTMLAIGELVADQLPATPSRKVPMQFGARLVSGALAGAAIGQHLGQIWLGLGLGILGAIVGTLGGAAARARFATMFGRDLPAALIEDVIAILGATMIVVAL